jgi:hypothetical protein
VVKIEVRDELKAGELNPPQTICYNTVPTQLSKSAATGGATPYSYLWEENTANVATGWTTASGSGNSETYTPPALTATKYYRRIVTGSNNCGKDTTDVVNITVFDELNAGALKDNMTICYNTSPGALSKTAPSGGANLSYKWEESSDNLAWTVISGETGVDYTPPALTSTRYYRRTVTSDSNCGEATTPVVTITVREDLDPGTIAADQIICNGKIPEKLTSLTPATGGDGIYDYEWQYSSDNGVTWQYTGVSNPAEYVPDALTQTTLFRRTVKDHTCNTSVAVASTPVTVTVRHPSLYDYPDLRIRVCPDGKPINLSKYIDTLDLTYGPQWSGGGINTTTGVLPANALGAHGVQTFTYAVKNPCVSDVITRKVYVETLKSGRMRPMKDTIVICYENADAVNINQIFGIDAGKGIWGYYAVQPDGSHQNIDKYVTESTSTKYGGAVVMNGAGIFGDSATGSYPYNGTTAKKVVFTYAPESGSCLTGSYRIVIMLTGN